MIIIFDKNVKFLSISLLTIHSISKKQVIHQCAIYLKKKNTNNSIQSKSIIMIFLYIFAMRKRINFVLKLCSWKKKYKCISLISRYFFIFFPKCTVSFCIYSRVFGSAIVLKTNQKGFRLCVSLSFTRIAYSCMYENTLNFPSTHTHTLHFLHSSYFRQGVWKNSLYF